MSEVALDAFIDSLKLLPFLFVIYVILEVTEHNAAAAINIRRALSGKWSPVTGAALGLVPQCGFSVAATELYSKKYVTVGTLMAVYLAASDEALPVLLSNPGAALKILPLFAVKFALAVIVGYSADLIAGFRAKGRPAPAPETAVPSDETLELGCGHKKAFDGDKRAKAARIALDYVAAPLWRSLKIWIWIFIVNLVFGTIIFSAGEEEFAAFIANHRFWQPLFAALVGLIPNCASSVVITQLFAVDAVGLGAAVAGLSVNAGVAPVVLFKKSGLKSGAAVLGALFAVSVAAGYIIAGFETLF